MGMRHDLVPWTGRRCSSLRIADFTAEVCQSPTGQEIPDVAAQQHDLYRPIDASRWQLPQRPLPTGYLDLLAWSDGGDFANGERWLQLFPTDGPSGVRAMTLAYHLPEHMPAALPFASNGGGVFYLFDMREPDADGEYPVVAALATSAGQPMRSATANAVVNLVDGQGRLGGRAEAALRWRLRVRALGNVGSLCDLSSKSPPPSIQGSSASWMNSQPSAPLQRATAWSSVLSETAEPSGSSMPQAMTT
jgi:hypothetical protein